ncbi:MAG: sigma-70 family RNA polymerase sigma factor [Chloroflexota bacterium]
MLEFTESAALGGLKELDSRAIGALYDRYYPEVYRYVRYRLNDEALAEDIASEVFVRLLEAVQGKRGPRTNVKGWLLGTASHIVTDHLRRSYRRPTEALDENMLDPLALRPEDFERREQQQRVRGALKNLTDEQQHVLALRFGEGHSLEETALLMNKNVNAVKALQFRALAALQRGIGEAVHD